MFSFLHWCQMPNGNSRDSHMRTKANSFVTEAQVLVSMIIFSTAKLGFPSWCLAGLSRASCFGVKQGYEQPSFLFHLKNYANAESIMMKIVSSLLAQ